MGTTDAFEIKRAVCQSCILSPKLFNLYVEREFTESISDSPIEIDVSGILINNNRYVNYTMILADDANDLQALLDQVHEESQRLGLKISTSNIFDYL